MICFTFQSSAKWVCVTNDVSGGFCALVSKWMFKFTFEAIRTINEWSWLGCGQIFTIQPMFKVQMVALLLNWYVMFGGSCLENVVEGRENLFGFLSKSEVFDGLIYSPINLKKVGNADNDITFHRLCPKKFEFSFRFQLSFSTRTYGATITINIKIRVDSGPSCGWDVYSKK